jgi:hypothetical protein
LTDALDKFMVCAELCSRIGTLIPDADRRNSVVIVNAEKRVENKEYCIVCCVDERKLAFWKDRIIYQIIYNVLDRTKKICIFTNLIIGKASGMRAAEIRRIITRSGFITSPKWS